MTLLTHCICGAPEGLALRINGIPTITCATCGIIRQDLPANTDLAAWYRDQYFAQGDPNAYSHSYAHDREVAKLRWKAYRVPTHHRVLDVGCGNGAFVHVGREYGADVWGQDLATIADGPRIYVGDLPAVAFPTEHFETVTCHDVLEHMPDPVAMLKEMARITKHNGRLLLDFPRFHVDEGRHHWKPVQHLWMFRDEDLVKLVTAAGFTVTSVTHPIPSKTLVDATRVVPRRPSVLVPAGIGDAYWAITKLQAFLKAHGLGDSADVYVQDAGGPRRTQPYLETIPFIHAAGYRETNGYRQFRAIWHEAYMQDGRTIYSNVADCDWFIAYNGILRHGKSLADVDPQYAPQWRFPTFISKAQEEMFATMRAEGPYCVAYFVSSGMYGHWLSDFPMERILEALRMIRERTGMRIVFLGAEWDRQSVGTKLAMSEAAGSSWVNMIGETSYEEMAGMLRGASAVVGWPSGATLVPPAWDVPTVLMWNKYFRHEFWWNGVAPDSPYVALDTARLTAPEVVAAVTAAQLKLLGRA